MDESANSIHPHVWRVTLLDAAGQTVFEQSGVDHVPTSLRGQGVVSWFTLDPGLDQGHVLPDGAYHIVLRLIDAWVPATLGEPLDVGDVTIGAPRRCSASA